MSKNAKGYIKMGKRKSSLSLNTFLHSCVFVKSLDFLCLIFFYLNSIQLQLGTLCFPLARSLSDIFGASTESRFGATRLVRA